MRITGGEHRGRTLKTLSGRLVRPTSDRVREALFNILRPRVDGAAALDLFAGTGSLGIEALSRGAARVVFVEKNRRALEIIRGNVEALGLEGRSTMHGFDVLTGLARLRDLDAPFDIVFVDPPYRMTETVEPGTRVGCLLELLWADGIVERTHGVVVLEHDRRSAVAADWENFTVSDTRTWGDTSISFLVSRE